MRNSPHNSPNMTRPPVGTVAQDASEAAIAAHVASRLAGVASDRAARDLWLESSGLRVRSNALDRAAPRARPGTRKWVLVDESTLPIDVQAALVAFPGEGARRPGLLNRLRRLGVVRQLMVTRSKRDVLGVLLFRVADRDALFAELEAWGERFYWDDLVEEDRRLEAGAWQELARRFAANEDLLGT